jgi:hypothetical protein
MTHRYLAACVAMAVASHASGQTLTERVPEFFQIEDAFIAERGALEARSSLELRRHEEGAIASLDLEFGLSERVSLGAALPWNRMHAGGKTHAGLGDISAELTVDVSGPARLTALAIACELTLPTGNETHGLGEGSVEHEILLIAARSLGGVQWHLNVGGAFSDGETAFVFGTSMLKQSAVRVVPTIELAGSVSGEGTQLYLTPGVNWRFGEELYIGAGMPIGLTRDSSESAVLLTVSFTL